MWISVYADAKKFAIFNNLSQLIFNYFYIIANLHPFSDKLIADW